MNTKQFTCKSSSADYKVSSNLQVLNANGPPGFKAVNEKKYRLFRETIACFRQIKQIWS